MCASEKLIVELDGPPHDADAQRRHDAERDAYLKRLGYDVLRFNNELVIGGGNIVLGRILDAVRFNQRSRASRPSSDPR